MVVKHTSELQGGFTPTRQFTQNILVLDVAARVQSLRCLRRRNQTDLGCLLPDHSVASIACLILFDFAAAFPSVFHDWIFIILEAIKAPIGFVNVVRSMYQNNSAFLKTSEGLHCYLMCSLEFCKAARFQGLCSTLPLIRCCGSYPKPLSSHPSAQ